MQSVDLIETYAYGRCKDLISEKEETKCNNIIKQYKKCLPFWCYKRKHNKHNSNSPKIPDHP